MKKFIEVHDANTRALMMISIDDIRAIIANPDQQTPSFGATVFFSNTSSAGSSPALAVVQETYDTVKKKLLACHAGCIVS